jgi:uncharacterized phage protein (TIGR01671 family)
MREIKFRAWDIESKKMVFVSELSFWCDAQGKHGFDIGVRWDDINDPVFGNPDTEYILMQYTGLKDKNGKEIYEGDILQWNLHHPTFKFHIEWDISRGKFYSPDGGATINEQWSEYCEVVDNIYENSEYLS